MTSDDRKNIKCDGDTFERLRELKDDAGFNWDPFLNAMADAFEALDEDSVEEGSSSGMSNEDLYKRLQEDILTTNPEKTADELEDRLR